MCIAQWFSSILQIVYSNSFHSRILYHDDIYMQIRNLSQKFIFLSFNRAFSLLLELIN